MSIYILVGLTPTRWTPLRTSCVEGGRASSPVPPSTARVLSLVSAKRCDPVLSLYDVSRPRRLL